MMNVLLRVSDSIDSFRQRAGRNVFWLVLVAALAAALVVPLFLFNDSVPIVVRDPVSKGAVRPAPPLADAAAPASAAGAAPATGAGAPPLGASATASATASTTASALAAPASKAPAPPRAAPKPAPAQPPAQSDERKPEASAPPADAAASAEPGRLFQVQLGAFAAEPRAHRLAERAARAGFPAVVIPVTIGDKVLHRVRLRDALPKEQAEALKSNLKQKIPTLEPVLMVSGS